MNKPKRYYKYTNGYVQQDYVWDEKLQKYICERQRFIAGDSEREIDEGIPFNDDVSQTEVYQPFDMMPIMNQDKQIKQFRRRDNKS